MTKKASVATRTASASKGAEASEKAYQGLRRFNLIMGFLHLVQGILMIVLSFALGDLKVYQVSTTVLNFDAVAQKLVPTLKLPFSLPFGPAVGAFLLISAIAHFSLGTFAYKWYVTNLKKGMNPARFYEYAFSSSIMIVLIALLTGVSDLGALIAMFGVNASMNLFGLLMELHNQTTKKTDWTSYIFGCFAGIIPWIVIVVYFVWSIASASPDSGPPSFVYGIIASLFVFFNIFAVNMYLQYKKVGPWRNYLFGERMYIILSLVAKTLLAWQVFAGVLAP
jgi:Heliorhodopsin